MTRYPTLEEIQEAHKQMIDAIGGSHGLLDQGALESAIAQPQMTFGGSDLYPTLAAKAAALGFSLINNHPFLDGNKRVGHAAMELLLRLNGYRLVGDIAEQERVILAVAAGEREREEFTEWIRDHIRDHS